MPTPEQRRALDRHLRAHHHVISSADLRARGFHREYATVQVRARRWQRVHRGVYCAYTGPLTFESRCAAALAACGPGAALSASTAVALHQGAAPSADTVHLVVPHTARTPRLRGVRVTRTSTLTERSLRTRRGLRVVVVERAVVAAALLEPRRRRTILTTAVQTGLTTAVRLRAAVLAMGNVSGRAALLRVIHQIEGGDRSALERRFITLVRRARLRVPAQNYPLLIEGRRLWLDVCYPDLRIAIEIDGRAYHLLSEDWEDDLARQNLVVLDGWLLLRFTARAIEGSPDLVVEQVRRAIASREALLVRKAG